MVRFFNVSFFLLLFPVVTLGCPHKCWCHLKTVDCDRGNLTEIPTDIPLYVEVFSLSRNRIAEIRPFVFSKLQHLKTLDLSYNNISRIYQRSFEGLSNLRRLFLQNNTEFFNNQLAQTASLFSPLSTLEELNIQNTSTCWLTGQPCYQERCWAGLKALKTLVVSGMNRDFGEGYRLMENITTLDLSDSPLLTELSGTTFRAFNESRVEKLFLRNCRLRKIAKETFIHLRLLQYLYLENNPNLGIQKASESFLGVYESGCPIKEINLNNVWNLDNRHPEIVSGSVTKYLKNTTISRLSMNSNKILYTEESFFENLPRKLRVFKMENTELRVEYSKVAPLSGLRSLFIIRASDTQRCTNGDKYGKEMKQATRLFSDVILLPPKLLSLELKGLCLPELPDTPRFGPNILRSLDLSSAGLSSLPQNVYGLNRLKSLEIADNAIFRIFPGVFVNMPQLEWLDMKNNQFGQWLDLQHDNASVFRCLISLKHLDLRNNILSYLPEDIFAGLTHLTQLLLPKNSIRNFDIDLTSLIKLEKLDLKFNKISHLKKRTTDQLENIVQNRTKLLVVELAGNPFECSCDTLDFLMWLNDKPDRVKIPGLEVEMCTLIQNGTLTSLSNLDGIIEYLRGACASRLPLILGLTGTAILVLVCITVALVYRYRWKLRFMFYTTVYGIKSRFPKTNDPRTPLLAFQYDAFVSYADEDRDFVIDAMRNQLENGDNPLSLCIHHRDFVPGEEISVNVVRAVRASRKTIAVLSPDFLKSRWCQFEFNMARMESMDTDRKVLLVVMYRPAEARQMSMEIMSVVKTESYIEWTEDVSGQTLFWSRLKRELKNEG